MESLIFLRGCAREAANPRRLCYLYARYKKDLPSENSSRVSHHDLLSLLSYVARSENNATHYLAISKSSCDFYQERTIVSIGVKLG